MKNDFVTASTFCFLPTSFHKIPEGCKTASKFSQLHLLDKAIHQNQNCFLLKLFSSAPLHQSFMNSMKGSRYL